ncbi:MAG: tRNA (adenosine(37)-N6)-threonylcarbamoyltransferase complex ATPase subunit type 1 TsaE [Candidatus Tectomicrobia bacterium RIFCSPLOWO2_12_FULL_69_37]|nr:MAG: tRNA (adenosine(37)-N6)-threonylcarbamoyltransferase complex ATPase subunit type 1 TsaE [Candidatus Tectomicrobia bacterium RIFCSPLOWO2_02_FULL_70_19]OGL69678.1 MAG: tRNA (adenosine(37)-N6)-threonylcarbamoyltransferase complex ATPase subunit type 1 TsaE [Candidatus Tectomicrobia bacterium RIFCSPLOWO2_12_FULL_69_37]
METASPEETGRLGAELAPALRPGEVVLIYGDLGAGKSVFARGLIRALPGGEGRPVRSPTFVFFQHHPTTPPVLHADLYRLPPGADPIDLGLEEQVGEGITLVEWPNRLDPSRYPARTLVRIEVLGEGRRRVEIERA